MEESWLDDVLKEIQASERPARERTVLVVEDDELLRLWLVKLLNADALPTTATATAGEALERLRTAPPRVVLTDKNLPDFTGIELIRRGRVLAPDTEFIIMTGDASLETAIEAVNLGAFAYLQKPFASIKDVLRRVHAALERRRVQRLNELLAERLRHTEGELLQARLELGSMQDVARERTTELKGALDRLLKPLGVVEDDVSTFAAFTAAVARGEPVTKKANAELGRLRMLETMVRRLHDETVLLTEQLDAEALR